MLRCKFTEVPIRGAGGAIDTDGQWVSWQHIHKEGDNVAEENDLLSRMVALAKDYHDHSHRHLPIWGEIGEIYAARRFNIRRHLRMRKALTVVVEILLWRSKHFLQKKGTTQY